MNVIKADIDKKGIWKECAHEDIEEVSAKPDETKVEIVVTLDAVVEIPKRWINVNSNGEVELQNDDDLFFIGLNKDDVCLTNEIDFGLIDYLDTDEPMIQLAKDD